MTSENGPIASKGGDFAEIGETRFALVFFNASLKGWQHMGNCLLLDERATGLSINACRPFPQGGRTVRSGKDKINSRYNTSIPEFIARARTVIVLLERRAASSSPPSFVPHRKYYDLRLEELYQAYRICFDPESTWEMKKGSAMQRLRRELKTSLASVANEVDMMLRYPGHLSAWPGFNTRRNPGRSSDSQRKARSSRQVPEAEAL